MNVNNVVRTITIRGTSEGIDELTSKLGKLAGAQENVAVVSETSAKRVLSLEDAWKKQSLKLDEAARSQAAIARETKIADGALREGLVTQQQHAERLNLISQKYAVATVQAGKFATQTGLNRYEILNFSRQIQDVGVSLAGGQSPFVVLAQQGSQIADIFQATNGSVRGFASQAIGWLGRFATSVAGAATGAFAIGAGALYAASSWADSQREIEKALIGIGRRSGVTANDINQIARSSASATGLSVDEARTAALEFVKTGAIYKENIKAATDVTRNFAIVTGQDAKDAAQELAKSLASPLEGADALNTKLGFLDGRTREYIATLVSQNQKQEAQAVLLRNLAPAIQEATNTLGPFERAWNAVANAASNAKNAVGAALTPRTDEQRRDALAQQVSQATPSSGFLPGTPVTSGDIVRNSEIKRAKAELDNLNETLRETARARALAFNGEVKISSDADEAVRALLPYIDQLKKVEEQLNKIKAAQDNPGAKDRQGLGGSNEAAARAAEVLKMNIKSVADETDRANARALQLTAAYGTTSIEVAKTLNSQQAQLVVASAVGGAARLAAQEQATYTDLINQGKSAEDAAAVAAGQRAIAQAQINSAARENLANLIDQREISSAITGDEKISAQAQATYNQLRRQGVDASIAAATAAEQERQARAQITAQVYQQATALDQQTELIAARLNGTEASVKAEQAYTNAIRAGADASAAAELRDATLRNEGMRQYVSALQQAVQQQEQANKAVEDQIYNNNKQIDLLNVRSEGEEAAIRGAHAYNDALRAGADLLHAQAAEASAIALAEAQAAKAASERARSAANAAASAAGGSTRNVGQYGYASVVGTPFNTSLGTGGYQDALSQFSATLAGGLSKTGTGLSASFGGGALDTDKISMLERLIAVMSPEGKIGATQSLLESLRGAAPSLERDEEINKLTESLKQLTDATNQNTSATQAMTDVLSPLYSSDPRTTHLGFRAFAGGGIMTPYGELPLHKYDGGGIARSPQVSIFGEGATPEAYVPVPNGRIPVEMSRPANSNQAPQISVNVNIRVDGNADQRTVDALKRTGYQQAQAMRRALG